MKMDDRNIELLILKAREENRRKYKRKRTIIFVFYAILILGIYVLLHLDIHYNIFSKASSKGIVIKELKDEEVEILKKEQKYKV